MTRARRPPRRPSIPQVNHAAAVLARAVRLESERVAAHYGHRDYGEASELQMVAEDVVRLPGRIETTRARLG